MARHHTDDERAACLACLAANGGNVAKTARECGVKRSTLQLWIKEQAARQVPVFSGIKPAPEKTAVAERVAAKVATAKRDLDERFERLAHKLVGVAYRGADKLNGKDAAIAAGVAVDKMLLLRGQPQSLEEECNESPRQVVVRTREEASALLSRLRQADAVP